MFRFGVRLIWRNVCPDVTIPTPTDPDLWIPDEQVVELVPELDELLLGFGLLGLVTFYTFYRKI